jgi:hypothetical protein
VETKERDKEITAPASADSHKPGARASARGAPPPRETAKPLLLVDIDGVISLFGGETALAERVAQGEGSLHSIEGMPHFLSATAPAHLLGLAAHFELAWCSGWEERANEHLPHLLGLPPGLPFLRFERSVGRSNAHWKLAAIDAFAGTRALAWIDDALNDACREWAQARARQGAPTLLVQTAPERGLTQEETRVLQTWARGLRADRALA